MCTLKVEYCVHSELCSVHRNSAKQADAPRDTSEGKSHGSWEPEVLPSLPGSILRHGEGGEAGRGDFDEAGEGSDRTRGQWGSFP